MNTATMEIKGASIKEMSGVPSDSGPTTVLVIDAPLNLDMADLLKCRYLFTLNDQPVKFEAGITLPLELGEDEAELSLSLSTGARTTMRPLKIYKFKISHITDMQLGVQFRSHFKGAADAQVISDFLHATNKDSFTCWVGSTQGELFAERAAGDGAAGGKRVDMSGAGEVSPISGPLLDHAKAKKASTGCKHCDAGIPLAERDDSTHVDGFACGLWARDDNPELTAIVAGVSPTAAEPVTFTPTTWEPDSDGVYDCSRTTGFELIEERHGARIDLLMIAGGEWIAAIYANAGKHALDVEKFTTGNTKSATLPGAIAFAAYRGESLSRAYVNSSKGTTAKAWLSITEWFHGHFAAQAKPLGCSEAELYEWCENGTPLPSGLE